MSTARYQLASHVRACHVDGQVILLDLRLGRYLGLGGTQLVELSRLIVDLPLGSPAPDDGQTGTPSRPWETALLHRGLLVPVEQVRVPAKQLIEPVESLQADLCQAPFRWRDVANVSYAASVAAYRLKRHSLADVARWVELIRARVDAPASPVAALRGAVASYIRVRPLMFSAHDKCLHDSLSLVRFLASRRMAAHWVIGVRTRPFSAHSWVQSGNVVLNDVHENVRAYSPILVV